MKYLRELRMKYLFRIKEDSMESEDLITDDGKLKDINAIVKLIDEVGQMVLNKLDLINKIIKKKGEVNKEAPITKVTGKEELEKTVTRGQVKQLILEGIRAFETYNEAKRRNEISQKIQANRTAANERGFLNYMVGKRQELNSQSTIAGISLDSFDLLDAFEKKLKSINKKGYETYQKLKPEYVIETMKSIPNLRIDYYQKLLSIEESLKKKKNMFGKHYVWKTYQWTKKYREKSWVNALETINWSTEDFKEEYEKHRVYDEAKLEHLKLKNSLRKESRYEKNKKKYYKSDKQRKRRNFSNQNKKKSMGEFLKEAKKRFGNKYDEKKAKKSFNRYKNKSKK